MSAVLHFKFDGIPPRRTLQSGRIVRVVNGQPVFVTATRVRMEATEMLHGFRRQLPEGWKASAEPAFVEIRLFYPMLKGEELPEGVEIPHDVRPDADNLVKSILDSMTRALVWVDDAQVYDLSVSKWRSAAPCWEVDVWFGGTVKWRGEEIDVAEYRRRIRRWRSDERRRSRGAAVDMTGELFGLEDEEDA